jgi:hypothetical protein
MIARQAYAVFAEIFTRGGLGVGDEAGPMDVDRHEVATAI